MLSATLCQATSSGVLRPLSPSSWYVVLGYRREGYLRVERRESATDAAQVKSTSLYRPTQRTPRALQGRRGGRPTTPTRKVTETSDVTHLKQWRGLGRGGTSLRHSSLPCHNSEFHSSEGYLRPMEFPTLITRKKATVELWAL